MCSDNLSVSIYIPLPCGIIFHLQITENQLVCQQSSELALFVSISILMKVVSLLTYMSPHPMANVSFGYHPIRLARNIGVSPKTIREIGKLVFQNQKHLVEKYHACHPSK